MRLIFEDDDLEIIAAALEHYGHSFNEPPKGIDIPELMSETERATRRYNATMSDKVRRLWRIAYETVNVPVEIEVKDL